jgi:hypothetical protein
MPDGILGHCETCRWWEPAQRVDATLSAQGVCRRYPPSILLGRTDPPHPPETWANTYCGEWTVDDD